MRPAGFAATPFELMLLLLLGVLWGVPYALTKVAITTMPAVTMVAARTSLAAAALWLVVVIAGSSVIWRRELVLRLFLQGVLGCAIPYTLIALAQRSVDSGLASILNSTGPVLVCLIELSRRRGPLPLQRLFGVAVGLGGVAIVTGAGAWHGLGEAAFAQLAVCAATVSSAFAVIHGRRLVAVSPEVVAAGALTSAALLLIPAAFVAESPLQCAPSAAAIAALAANALVATALGFVVYFRLIRTVGSVGTASVGYLRPGVGVLIGCLLLGERLTWSTAVGLGVILIGVAAINSQPLAPLSAAAKRPLRGAAAL